MKPTVYLQSLGCAKNLVDSDLMRGVLKKDRFTLVNDPEDAEVIIINTCGFIEAAKIETIDTVLELAQYKTSGKCRLLVAVGCMVEKYAAEMAEALPELDGLMGSGHYQDIGIFINGKLGHQLSCRKFLKNIYLERDYDCLSATAYLKIAEGCNSRCSFCLIPQLRGPYKSRPMEDIVEEAKRLYQAGVKELVLLAQDTTYYGLDIYGKRKLAELLAQVAQLPFAMIRLLYAYPEGIDETIIKVISQYTNICHYLDMPVQHGVNRILSVMNRPDTRESILKKIQLLRRVMPDIALRTTLMVGFPGESEEDFTALLAFIEEAQFDWIGAFPYCREEDTPAAELEEQIDERIKQERLDMVMNCAAQITSNKLRKYQNQILLVLVTDTAAEIYGEGWFVGRSQYQAPEVDGVIYFSSQNARIGDIVQVKITDQEIYDLIGVEL